jgi:hypothetical protein
VSAVAAPRIAQQHNLDLASGDRLTRHRLR